MWGCFCGEDFQVIELRERHETACPIYRERERKALEYGKAAAEEAVVAAAEALYDVMHGPTTEPMALEAELRTVNQRIDQSVQLLRLIRHAERKRG